MFEDSPSSSPIKRGGLFTGQQSPFTRRAFTTFSKTTLSFNDHGAFQLLFENIVLNPLQSANLQCYQHQGTTF
jgi:hypothetical protein